MKPSEFCIPNNPALDPPIAHVMRNRSRYQWYRIEIVWNLGDERPFVDRIPALSVKDAKQFALKNYPNAACITITTDGAL